MADDIATSDGGDDVAKLVALTERQHELWGLLRDAEDEQVRNQLFDELTSNREELGMLKEAVSAQVDEPVLPPNAPMPAPDSEGPRSVGERLRSSLLTPAEQAAPAQPPPPPPPPPMPPVPAVESTSPEPAAESDPEPEPESVPEPEPVVGFDAPGSRPKPESESQTEPDPEPQAESELQAESEPESSLSPEQTPFSSREADLAAMRGEVAPPPAEQSAPRESVDVERYVKERDRHAHEAYQEIARVRPVNKRSFPIIVIIVAIAAVILVAYYVFFVNRGDGGEAPAAATTTTTAPAGENTTGNQIQSVVNALGVGSIMVDLRDDTVYLFGVLGSAADRSAVIGASEALAGDLTVDSTGLIVSAADEDKDLRATAIAAISAAGFDKVNVTVSGTVATLTGVTPEEGTDDLIAALTSVEGIEQVVDLTESSDRAAALRNELDRLIAVTPIVYGSGEIAPTELHERVLDNVAEIILAYDGPIVTVVGYTDAAGTDEENIVISQRRAEEVLSYLVSQGVPAERMVVDGRGEASASGAAAVAGLERRVEFEVGYVVPAGGDADFRIGIVAPSARNDLAFTQSIVDAANVIAAEVGGVGIDISDGLFVVDDAEAAIRGYAADGYDLVIA
ncbi:MAG: OmpA family protein, partial [bacterium]|nr:OmpA family protein [bacterium]